MTAEERETTVSYSDADQVATVMSYNSTMVNRLRKLLDEHPDEVKLVWEEEGGIEVRVPKTWVKISPKRQFTEEHLASMRAHGFHSTKTVQNSAENEEFEG